MVTFSKFLLYQGVILNLNWRFGQSIQHLFIIAIFFLYFLDIQRIPVPLRFVFLSFRQISHHSKHLNE